MTAPSAPAPTAPGPTRCTEPRNGSGRIEHAVAHATTWPWIPTATHGHLAKHPWCKDCGSISALGADRALDMGGIVNLLSRLEKRLREHDIRLTEAQRRLVVKRIEGLRADDAFGQRRSAQLHIIATVVATLVGQPADTMHSYVRSC